MAKKTIKDLRPNDTIWSLHNGKIEEHKIFSISTEQLETLSHFFLRISDGNITSWVFEGRNKYDSKQMFHLNKIDALKLRHIELEKDLKGIYDRQQAYFDSIIAKNEMIYKSHLEIINEMKKDK